MGTEAPPLGFPLGVWRLLGKMPVGGNFNYIFLPGVWQSRKLGRAAWKPEVALTTPVLSLTSSAPSDPELSLNRTQTVSSTKAWSPGSRDARRPFLANNRGQSPRDSMYPAIPKSSPPWPAPGESATHPWPATRWREHNPPLVSSRMDGRITAYPWWAAGSQDPGSRALCTALLRRTLSW